MAEEEKNLEKEALEEEYILGKEYYKKINEEAKKIFEEKYK